MGYFLLGLLCLVSLQGCAQPPSPEEINAADYGAFPRDYQSIIKAYLHATLKDPYSAQYESWRGPTRSWSKVFGNTLYGYAACVMMNAKNSYGAYTGLQLHYFMMHNNAVTRHLGGSGQLDQELAAKGCAGV